MDIVQCTYMHVLNTVQLYMGVLTNIKVIFRIEKFRPTEGHFCKEYPQTGPSMTIDYAQ